ncbi:hypothetical protein K503DRAFT_791816 [Rhizopogon vinicolor AM-OR11-026]|uniref:Wax synthase domain-containing protein n=1 Tax=Rhizopogon vinicolor AM-OR11-026 TaxID=1314800 RepID=A0A1B7N4D2_9AGAM|nr:hypothetical protein K503DRAFT_791816 [Rhizopogon vinicolor AM-OR11-026]
MRTAMLSLPDYLRPTTSRAPLTTENFVSNIVPPVICYFTTAFLVLLPRTQPIRVALWPITAFLAFRAAGALDMSLSMFIIAIRTLQWTIQTKPFIRLYQATRPVDQRSSTDAPKRNIVLDALDLACTLRGCGWDWSRGLYIPRETRPTSSRFAFAITTLISSLAHAFFCGALHSAVQSFGPDTLGSVDGGTIFDDSLPPHLRYFRSSIISTLGVFSVYSVLRAADELLVVICVLILRHHPNQCPPSFDSPWCATSLGDFWGRRWHQWFRHVFIFIGGRPLSLLFGRAAGVIGAFLASGIFHHVAVLSLDRPCEMWRMLLPFGMMGVGVVLERTVAGKNVGGWTGWVWTMFWMILWGNVIIDGWARAGMLGGSSILDSATPVRQPIERLVRTFNEYLHAR